MAEKVPAGTPPQEDPKAQKAAAKEQQVHEEGAEKRSAAAGFGSYDDAYSDYQEKAQKLAELQTEVLAAEQALPELKIAEQQAFVDEAKEQDTEYTDDGRLVGAGIGTRAGEDPQPVANPHMYGGNPDPKTLQYVH